MGVCILIYVNVCMNVYIYTHMIYEIHREHRLSAIHLKIFSSIWLWNKFYTRHVFAYACFSPLRNPPCGYYFLRHYVSNQHLPDVSLSNHSSSHNPLGAQSVSSHFSHAFWPAPPSAATGSSSQAAFFRSATRSLYFCWTIPRSVVLKHFRVTDL